MNATNRRCRDCSKIHPPCRRCGTALRCCDEEVGHDETVDGVCYLCKRTGRHNTAVRDCRAQRKAQLAAMPRCEYCNRRGSYLLGLIVQGESKLRVCGHHRTAVARIAHATPCPIFHTWYASELRELMNRKAGAA